jgi:hypothetical protein
MDYLTAKDAKDAKQEFSNNMPMPSSLEQGVPDPHLYAHRLEVYNREGREGREVYETVNNTATSLTLTDSRCKPSTADKQIYLRDLRGSRQLGTNGV